jgi:hypothetical protein
MPATARRSVFVVQSERCKTPSHMPYNVGSEETAPLAAKWFTNSSLPPHGHPLSYATLAHVEFVYAIYYQLAPLPMLPGMKAYAHFEHVIAFAIFGGLFAFAYPKRIVSVCIFILLTAGAL